MAIMNSIKTKQSLLFSVECPYLGRTVVLKKGTWYGKIVLAHPEMNGRLDLVKDIIEEKVEGVKVYRKKNNRDSVRIYYHCPDILKYQEYLRVGVNVIDKFNAEVSVITTAFGTNNTSIDGMEEIK